MNFEFDAALFGLENDQAVVWASKAAPEWNGNRYSLNAGFGTSGMSFSVNDEKQT